MQYNVSNLTFEEKKQLLLRAKAVCQNWWVDILDCAKSYSRQEIEMSFEEILGKFNKDCHFAVVHRHLPPVENYLEIGFSTFADPSYFLWKYLPEFTSTLV
jgi:hypothetical protein